MSDLQQYYAQQRRLHPLTLIYRGITSIPGLFIPLYFVFFNQDKNEMFYLGLAVLYGVMLLPMLILRWYYYYFWISPKEMIIRQGIIAKKQRNIPIERIQNVDIQQNLLQRLLGIAIVKAETAGGLTAEASLEYVSKSDAEDIRQIIRSYQKEIEGNKPDIVQERSKIDEIGSSAIDFQTKEANSGTNSMKGIIFKMGIKELAVYGMLRFRPLVLAGVFIIYQYFTAFNPESFFRQIEQSESLQSILQQDTITVFFFIFIGLFLVMLISWIADIAMTINQFYGFTLSYEENKLFSEYGLLGKRKGIIPLKKLQSLVMKSNIITRRFSLYSLDMQTAGIDKRNSAAEAALPLARFDRVVSLIKDIKGYDFPEKFENVSRKTIRRAVVRYFIMLVPVALAAYFVFPGFLWLLILSPLLYFAALLRYQYRGYSFYDNYIVIKQGFIYQRISFIPIEKIQTLNVVANIFQRRLGLATLNIDTAATSGLADASIIDISMEDADDLLNKLAHLFANVQRT